MSLKLRVALALLTMYIAWGTTYIGIAYVIESMPDLLSMGMRFLAAGVIQFSVVAARSGIAQFQVSFAQLRNCVILGTTMLAVGIGTMAAAEHVVPLSTASLLVAAMPLWTAALRAVTGDRPRAATLIGIIVGFAGLIVIMQPGRTLARPGAAQSRVLVWMVIIVLGSLLWAVSSFMTTRVTLPSRPLVLTTYEMLAAGSVLTVMGLAGGQRFQDFFDGTGRSWAGWIYLVVVGSVVGYSTYNFLLANAPISLVATYSYVNPMVATALAVLLFDEHVTRTLVIGGAAILVSVALVASSERVRAPMPEAETL